MTTTSSSFNLGMAANDLGLNLPRQVEDETDDERKKRLLMQRQSSALGPAAETLGLGAYG